MCGNLIGRQSTLKNHSGVLDKARDDTNTKEREMFRHASCTSQKMFLFRNVPNVTAHRANFSSATTRSRSSTTKTAFARKTTIVVRAMSADAGPRDLIDLRVGKVTKCTVHPDADKLYVEEIDLREAEGPRTICSGLVPFMKEEDILGKNVIVVANLKARNMQGVKSHGMLLAASNETHDKVELLVAPKNAKLGSRVVFGDAAFNGEPASANQVQKKKYWEAFGPELVTNGEMEASWKEDGAVMRVELEGEEGDEGPTFGSVKCESLTNALVG